LFLPADASNEEALGAITGATDNAFQEEQTFGRKLIRKVEELTMSDFNKKFCNKEGSFRPQ